MCVASAGRIVAISWADAAPEVDPDDPERDLWRCALVDFGGVRQPVSLACVPEARLGDQVLVHVGLALCLVATP